MNVIFKSFFQPASCGYKLIQIQLPCVSSLRYKSVGIQKKIKTEGDIYKFDSPNSLLLQELQEETDYVIPLTPEHIKDQVEFRKLEMKSLQSRMEIKSIEQKYFRQHRREVQREPNLLTWAMKEHLVNLHQLDPDTWTIETLSYAFPASQFRVSQILKSKLNRPSEEKLKKHDESVLRNWKTLTKGKFGSIALLRKVISERLQDIGGETLPAEIDVSQRKNDFIFTPVGDIYGEKELLSTPVGERKHYWFRDIITKYEERKLLANTDNSTSTAITTTNDNEKVEFEKCKDLNEIRSMRNQNYDDQSPAVPVSYETKSKKRPKRPRNVTYEQFINKKNKK